MASATFEDHPTDPDKVILRKKPYLDKGRDYEEGFVDGMQHQMQSSVDKAVNAMSRNAWADKYQNEQWHKAAIRLGEELASVGPVGYYEMDASEWLDWALNQLKEKNT